MNTPSVDSVAALDLLIQVAARQQILVALQKPGITLDTLTKTMKLYQKTIDQELKAKALELKKQELAFKAQKLAADQAKAARKQQEEDLEKENEKQSAKERVVPTPTQPGKRKPVWPEAEAMIAAIKEKRLDDSYED